MLSVADVKPLLGHSMEEIELALIDAALEKTGGHVAAAAVLLGISGRTIYRKINRYMEEAAPR